LKNSLIINKVSVIIKLTLLFIILKWKTKVFIKFVKIVVYIIIFISLSVLADQQASKKVLFVNSYHADYEWSNGILAGIKDIFKDKAIELKTFEMDTKRNRDESFKEEAALKAKAVIESFQPDVVIAADDSASKYLIMPYFKDADLPFVFCGVNWDSSVYGFPFKNVTGMEEVALVPQIIAHLKEHTKGDKIAYLAADVFTQQKVLKYHKKLLNIDYDQVHLVKTFAEWKNSYLKLQDEVDMIMMGNHNGISDWDEESAQQFVVEHSKIPTGTEYNFEMPFSLLGITKVAEEQGIWVAETALKILEGTSPSDIPIVQNKQGKSMINMRIAKKIGVVFKLSVLKTAEIIH